MLVRSTSNGGTDLDPFVRVVRTIVDTTLWRYDGDRSAVDRAQEAIGRGDPVVRLQHPGTDANLEVEYRGDENILCELALFATLDTDMRSMETRFSGSLAESHEAIAGKFATEYVCPQCDVEVVLTAELPAQVAEIPLNVTVSAISATAIEVERLHRNICAPMSEYVRSPCGKDEMGYWFSGSGSVE